MRGWWNGSRTWILSKKIPNVIGQERKLKEKRRLLSIFVWNQKMSSSGVVGDEPSYLGTTTLCERLFGVSIPTSPKPCGRSLTMSQSQCYITLMYFLATQNITLLLYTQFWDFGSICDIFHLESYSNIQRFILPISCTSR